MRWCVGRASAALRSTAPTTRSSSVTSRALPPRELSSTRPPFFAEGSILAFQLTCVCGVRYRTQLLRDRHVDLRLPLGDLDLDLDHRVVDRFRFLDRHFCLG